MTRTAPTLGRIRRDVAAAVAGAGRDLRASWRPRSWAWLGAFVAATLVPLAVSDARAADFASWLCTVLAAIGLNAAVGIAGMPVLGQGAFMAVGAFTGGLLVAHAGWDPAAAALAGVALSLLVGAAVGAVAARLQPAYVAVATWLEAWLVALALAAFPSVSGGAQGLVVPDRPSRLLGAGPLVRPTPAFLYEVLLALAALALLASRAAAANRPGLALAAVRQGPGAAAAIGVPVARLRWGAMVAAAGAAGLGGALLVDVVGVADPASFGPLRSVELFLAVVVGGAGTTLGPVVGAAVLAVLPAASGAAGAVFGVDRVRFEPVLTAVLLLAALVAGRGGLVHMGAAAWRRVLRREAPRSAAPVARPPSDAPPVREHPPSTLEGAGLAKRFGGVVAVRDADVDVVPGRVHALIGPNGSGKSTVLRLLSGALPPDAGRVRVGDVDLTPLGARARVAAGVARTLQATAVFGDMTALDHAVAGTDVLRRRGGALRIILATPQARAEAHAMTARARAALDRVGLTDRAGVRAAELSVTEQRLLMIATALASAPSAILLDEPSAGMAAGDLPRLAEVIDGLRADGLAVLVVEHNLRLVRRVAETVTVLDAGRVVARGAPDDVAADPEVRLAYLGRTTL